MIAGFVAETSPLTPYELDTVLPRLLSGFKRINKSKTSTEIIDSLKKEGIKLSGPRLRKLINHIRTNDLIIGLVGDDKGYRVEKDPEKIKEYLEGLKSRIYAIGHVFKKMTQQYEKIKGESHQATLFDPNKVIEDALDNGSGIGSGSPGMGASERRQAVIPNDQKTRAVLAAEDWWRSENQIQYGR